jgi:hypothetical protein
MKIGDLVGWKSDHGTADDIGIILSFHLPTGDPFIWWTSENECHHCSKNNLGDTLILLGGDDESR